VSLTDVLLTKVPLSWDDDAEQKRFPLTLTLALLNVAVVLSSKLLLVGVDALAVMTQRPWVNLAPPEGILMVSSSPLLCGSLAGSPASVFVSDQEPLVVTVTVPRLSVQPLNVAGGLLVTLAVKLGELDDGVLAVIVTLVHVTVVVIPLTLPVSVMLPLLETLKEVLAGVRVSPASARAGAAAKAIMAPAAAMTMAILLVARNMISPLGA
jgi:hypothetical protein